METLMDSETLKQYDKETNEYIKKKNIDKLFDVILKNVLINKPKNVYMYIYNNIYTFLLNKIFIIGPPLLRITSIISTTIANYFNYYYISTYHLVKSYISKNEESEEEESNKVLVNDELITSLVKNAIKNVDPHVKRGYVVEGYPRNNLQAQKCIHFVPSYVIVLWADENYIYKKYKEENDINILSDEISNILITETDTETETEAETGTETETETETERESKRERGSKQKEKRTDVEKERIEEKKEFSLPFFEFKNIDTKLLRDKVNFYIRNLSDILNIFEVLQDKKQVFNITKMTNEELIQNVINIIEESKDKWTPILGELTHQEKDIKTDNEPN